MEQEWIDDMKRQEYDFLGKCHDMLRDMWNDGTLDRMPEYKARIARLFGIPATDKFV